MRKSPVLDLPTILKQADAASPGPWQQSLHSVERDYVFDPDSDPVAVATTRRGNANPFRRNEANAEFIAASRTNVPMLVAALQEAQVKLSRIETDMCTCNRGLVGMCIAHDKNSLLARILKEE